MSHYKPYPAYKDSGVEWIGRLPEHWSLGRLRDFVRTISTGPFGTALGSDDYVSNGVPVINPSHISESGCVPDVTVTVDQDKATQLAFWAMRPGDIVTARRGELGRAAIIRDQQTGWICGTGSIRITPDSSKIASDYVHATLQADYARRWLELRSVGSTMPNLSEKLIGELPMAVPPTVQEQQSLLGYAAEETARIDALIAKKTRFIDLLKEKRQALITHAVTKGLDPNVKMKDSGVEWIGEVPEHWVLNKFGRVARVTEGLVDPRIEPYRAMPLFAPNHIESGTGRLIAVESAAEQDAESGKYICKAGCVVYSKIRPALSKVIIAPTDGLCSADMYPLTCTDSARPRWLFYLMLSQPFTAWAVLESDRVAMPKINRESLSDLIVAVPPSDEQQQIAAAIDTSLPRVDAVTAKVNASITLLKERRSALITAAVTGQIDLRGASFTDPGNPA